MDNDPIKDEEKDINEIMNTIRDNILRKREADSFSPDTRDTISPSSQKNNELADIAFLESNHNIRFFSYTISSHRPYIGWVLVKGRQLVNGEVKRYVDPLLTKQSEWNHRAYQVLKGALEKLKDLNKRTNEVSSQIQDIESRVASLATQISDIENTVSETEKRLVSFADSDEMKKRIRKEVQVQVREILQFADAELKALSTFADIIKTGTTHRLGSNSHDNLVSSHYQINYLDFEDRFRGTREDIKNRQTTYLKYFSGCSNVLDIGCGRGEFLELLRENNIEAHGVDNNEDMVDFCHSLFLDVTLSDAMDYLESLKEENIDGIFLNQVVEHLKPFYLIRLLELCAKKMIPGGYIIVETVNPLSVTSLMNFYLDLSHERLVHPETLKYLLNFAGFQEISIQFSHPVVESEVLQSISDLRINEIMGRENVEICNRNIAILNNKLFGAQDYAVVGKKK